MSASKGPVLLIVLAVLAPAAYGEVVFDGSPGTGPPPAMLGPYTMLGFPPDTRPIFGDVTDVDSPLGGQIVFSRTLSHRRIGEGWASWSHGYTGDVYFSDRQTVTMTLPAATGAFYFYVEPGPFDWFEFTAVADHGTSSGPIAVHGDHGAAYFGFYGTEGSTIGTITLSIESSGVTFSIGEFGIALFAGEPSTLFVDDNGASGADGGSWNRATRYLQDALNTAASDYSVTEIRVAGGVYKPDQDASGTMLGDRTASFRLRLNLAIRGGYRGLAGGGDANDRDLVAFESLLSGDLAGDDEPGFVNNDENSLHVVKSIGVDHSAVLDGFTITAGNADGSARGGGMVNTGSPMVTDCTFVGSSANEGGGVSNRGQWATPILTDCTFTGNRAETGGGGMLNMEGSRPILTSCSFSENSAAVGGGMHNVGHSGDTHSSPVMTDCAFVGNAVSGDGGGMHNAPDCAPSLEGCILLENIAGGRGGAIYNDNSTSLLTDCLLAGNSAQDGGGMFCQDAGGETLTNCWFSGNSAEAGGGALRVSGDDPTLTNCTLSENEARFGGGLYVEDFSQVLLTSCILWGNRDFEGSTELSQIRGFTGAQAFLFYTCIEDLDSYVGNGNIGDNPLFVDAGGTDDLLGTPDDNLRLAPGSPGIDTGDPTFVGDPGETDPDGYDRVYDGDGDGFARVDMGAFEFHSCSGDLDGDAEIGLADLATLLASYGTTAGASYGDGDLDFDGDVDLSDLAALLAAYGTTCE